MHETVEIKIARIEEKISGIEKISERICHRLNELEQNYIRADFCERSVQELAKELTKVTRQQTAFKAFAGGIGFAFSILGGIAAALVKKLFSD